jgi:damage-control phosphatase, subfamily III
MDLSVSAGKEVKVDSDPFEALESLESSILIDKTTDIWESLSSTRGSVGNDVIVGKVVVFVKHYFFGLNAVFFHVFKDIINDNAGYELFTDFCLAEFLLELNLATRYRLFMHFLYQFIYRFSYLFLVLDSM